jgi:hypothetical protein
MAAIDESCSLAGSCHEAIVDHVFVKPRLEEDEVFETGLSEEGKAHPAVGIRGGEGCSHGHSRESAKTRSAQLRKWDKMSRKGVDSFLKNHPEDFWRRVQRGIPQEHRWVVWQSRLLQANSVANGRDIKEREKILFSGPNAASCIAGLLSRESTWSQAIQRDAVRTFQGNPEFTEAYQQSFCRVLNAYAFLNPEVGYVQGMGYVVGILLLASKCSEHETLFVFVRLMEDCGLNGFYKEGFPLLERYCSIFDHLMDELMPDLRRHFACEGVQTSEYFQPWLLSLFVHCLPLPTVLMIWDNVMCNGLPHLVLAAIALLSSVKHVLLQGASRNHAVFHEHEVQ